MPQLRITFSTAVVLQAIGHGYRHGFDIMDASGLPDGTVYPALRRLERGGLVTSEWEDKTEASLRFLDEMLSRQQTEGWMPVGLHLLMGENTATKFANLRRNLEKGRLRVVQDVMTRES